MDHLTAVFVVPTTLAVNCADRPADSPTGPGKIETLTLADHRLTEAATSIPNMVVADMKKVRREFDNGDEITIDRIEGFCKSSYLIQLRRTGTKSSGVLKTLLVVFARGLHSLKNSFLLSYLQLPGGSVPVR